MWTTHWLLLYLLSYWICFDGRSAHYSLMNFGKYVARYASSYLHYPAIKELPVISFGCFIPITCKTVGATSASMPSDLNVA